MIKVTRINDEEIIVNAVMVEFVESTPDTVLSMVSGRKLMVRESVDEVRLKIQTYYQVIGLGPKPLPDIVTGNGDFEIYEEN